MAPPNSKRQTENPRKASPASVLCPIRMNVSNFVPMESRAVSSLANMKCLRLVGKSEDFCAKKRMFELFHWILSLSYIDDDDECLRQISLDPIDASIGGFFYGKVLLSRNRPPLDSRQRSEHFRLDVRSVHDKNSVSLELLLG